MRRRRRRRGEERRGGRGEEQTTDIKTNNPHLTGGEQKPPKIWTCLGLEVLPWFLLVFVFFVLVWESRVEEEHNSENGEQD